MKHANAPSVDHLPFYFFTLIRFISSSIRLCCQTELGCLGLLAGDDSPSYLPESECTESVGYTGEALPCHALPIIFDIIREHSRRRVIGYTGKSLALAFHWQALQNLRFRS